MDLYMIGYGGFIAIINCKKCSRCANICPNNAFYGTGETVKIDYEKCDLCMKCTNQ